MFSFKTLLKWEKRHLIRLGYTIQEIAESNKITFIFKKGFCQHDFFPFQFQFHTLQFIYCLLAPSKMLEIVKKLNDSISSKVFVG
jgi:hypothetical protein